MMGLHPTMFKRKFGSYEYEGQGGLEDGERVGDADKRRGQDRRGRNIQGNNRGGHRRILDMPLPLLADHGEFSLLKTELDNIFLMGEQ